MHQDYITASKKQELEIELKELLTVKRPETISKIESAKALGDLSENAEYHSAREEQGRLEERIARIEYILKNSQVAAKSNTGEVAFSSTVSIKKTGASSEQTFTIVSSEEADMTKGKISNHSPLGVALLGKCVGDTIEVKSPKGKTSYTITRIS